MLTVVDGIVGVAAKLLGLKGELSKAGRARKDRLAELLDKIGGCLERVVADLDKNVVPHGACAELEMYAQTLPSLVAFGRIPEEAAFDLGRELWEHHKVEGLVGEVREPAAKAHLLGKLEAAAGEFKALGNILRL